MNPCHAWHVFPRKRGFFGLLSQGALCYFVFVNFPVSGVLILPLAIVATLILLMKLAEFGPVAEWSWLWVLAPWGVLALWWEVIAPLIGWDKRVAAKEIEEEERLKKERRRKMNGL